MNPFLGVLFAELRMLLNGRRWWWWAITAGLNIAILTSPLEMTKDVPAARRLAVAAGHLVGDGQPRAEEQHLPRWSSLPRARCCASFRLPGWPAFWRRRCLSIAGAVFLLSNGDLPGLAGWVGAVIFVPTLALALGVFSSGSRVFEVVYVIWWYIGPLQKSPGMDFTAGAPQVYLLAAAGLLLLSAYWRGRQVRV